MDNPKRILLSSFFACGNIDLMDDQSIPQVDAVKIFSQLFLMDDATARSRFSMAIKQKPEWFEFCRGLHPDSIDRRRNYILITPEGYRVLIDEVFEEYFWDIIRNWQEKSRNDKAQKILISNLKKYEDLKITSLKNQVKKKQMMLLRSISGFSEAFDDIALEMEVKK